MEEWVTLVVSGRGAREIAGCTFSFAPGDGDFAVLLGDGHGGAVLLADYQLHGFLGDALADLMLLAVHLHGACSAQHGTCVLGRIGPAPIETRPIADRPAETES